MRAVRLSWAAAPDDLWRPSTSHVDGLQPEAETALLAGMDDAWESMDASPLGLVLQGQRGVGKTHLLGWIRQQVQAGDGYFFPVSFHSGGDFWRSAVQGVLDGLWRPAARSRDQLGLLLDGLAERMGAPAELRTMLADGSSPTREQLDSFVAGLRRLDRHAGTESQDTARALVLYGSEGPAHEVGRGFLSLGEDVDADEQAAWGLQRGRRPPRLVLRDLSRLLALTGPTVVAVDQIDTLLAAARQGRADAGGSIDARDAGAGGLGPGRAAPESGAGDGWAETAGLVGLLNQVADGLMALREETRRTLTVVSCLPTSWELVARTAVDTVPDRFRVLRLRDVLPSPRAAAELVAKRLLPRYRRAAIEPPHPTWPVEPDAFADATRLTARSLLQRVDEHITECLAAGAARPLTRLVGEPGPVGGDGLGTGDGPVTSRWPAPSPGAAPEGDGIDLAARPTLSERPPPEPRLSELAPSELAPSQHPPSQHPPSGEAPLVAPPTPAPAPVSSRFDTFDERFYRLREAADVRDALAAGSEDAAMPPLLAAALTSLAMELRPDGLELTVDPPPSARPPLHARLRLVLDEATEDEAHWSFRAVASDDPRTVQSRLRQAEAAAGVATDAPQRRLVLLRASDWPSGRRTAEVVEAAGASGVVVLAPSEYDLRTFSALRSLLADDPPGLPDWLLSRKPAGRSELLRTVARDLLRSTDTGTARAGTPAGTPGSEPAGPSASAGTAGSADVEPAAGEPAAGQPAAGQPAAGAHPAAQAAVPLGRSLSDGRELASPLGALRRHVTIVGGGGSGRTGLLRRLVEESALQGVSSIVLDTDGSLTSLGEAWPEPPPDWQGGDAERAAAYLATTDVALWRPDPQDEGASPWWQPLPDLRPLLPDASAFDSAVGAVAAGITPHAWTVGAARAPEASRSLLHQAIARVARDGGGLGDVVELLRDLPDTIGHGESGWRLANQMADTLAAAADGLLVAGTREPADPGALLRPPVGKRARVSVVDLTGLLGLSERQTYVHQMQTALHAWLATAAARRQTREDGLAGLLVMDTAETLVPSRASTASARSCVASTVALASRSAAPGIGLVTATGSPRALDRRVTGGAATLLLGLLHSPAEIEATVDLARAQGRAAPDVARLPAGQFHALLGDTESDIVTVPTCLSHHPTHEPSAW